MWRKLLWPGSESLLVTVKKLPVQISENEARCDPGSISQVVITVFYNNVLASPTGAFEWQPLFQLPPWTFLGPNWSWQETAGKQAIGIASSDPCLPTHVPQLCRTTNGDIRPPQGVYCVQLQSVPTQCHNGCHTAWGLKRKARIPPGTQVAQQERVYGREWPRYTTVINIHLWSREVGRQTTFKNCLLLFSAEGK